MQWSYFEAVLMMMYKKDFNRAQRLSCWYRYDEQLFW